MLEFSIASFLNIENSVMQKSCNSSSVVVCDLVEGRGLKLLIDARNARLIRFARFSGLEDRVSGISSRLCNIAWYFHDQIHAQTCHTNVLLLSTMLLAHKILDDFSFVKFRTQ